MTLLFSAAATGAAPSGAAGFINFAMPMALVFLVFWVLVFRPQQKKVKDHQAAIAAIKKGDEIVTAGGIRARVSRLIDDNEAEVEIAQGVKVRLVKSTIAQVLTVAAKPAND